MRPDPARSHLLVGPGWRGADGSLEPGTWQQTGPVSSTGPAKRLGLSAALRTRSRGFISYSLIVRVAIATTVSYLLAANYSGSPLPLFAPITTLLVVQASPFSTLGMTAQRVLGTALGVGVTTLYVNVVPISWWTVLLAILLSLLAARALPVGLSGQLQLPLAAVFVIALGPTDVGIDLWRVADVLMGAAIGVLAVFVAPSRPKLRPAVDALDGYLGHLTALLAEIAAVVVAASPDLPRDTRHGFIATSRALPARSASATTALEDAVESTRFNFRRHDIEVDVDALTMVLQWCDRLAIQTRSLAGAVDRLYHHPGPPPALPAAALADALHRLAALITARHDEHQSEDEHQHTDQLSDELVTVLRDAVRQTVAEGMEPEDALDSLGILGRVEQLRVLGVGGPGPMDDIEDRVADASAPSRRPGASAVSAQALRRVIGHPWRRRPEAELRRETFGAVPPTRAPAPEP